MKKITLGLFVAALLATPSFAESKKMVCQDTKKAVSKCCCESSKDGKFYCTLSKKTHDSCCCKGM